MPVTRRFRSNLSPTRDLEPYFPHAREMDPKIHANPQGHTVLCDPEIFPGCGYMTHDEAALLQAVVRHVNNHRPAARRSWWCEIGSHTGWSTAHIADAVGDCVAALEPEFDRVGFNKTGDPAAFRRRFDENIARCGTSHRVVPVGFKSQDVLRDDSPVRVDWNEMIGFAGAFVDGEHEPPFPADDARLLIPRLDLEYPVAVVFHDVLGRPVQDGVRVLVDAGFRWRLYRTPQLMAVCWRDGAKNKMPTMVDHVPDPSFDWDRWIKGTLGGLPGLDLVSQS